jgi:hypothetical protein
MEAKPVKNDPIEILPKPFPFAETNETEIIDDINVEVEKDSAENNLVSLVNSPSVGETSVQFFQNDSLTKQLTLADKF